MSNETQTRTAKAKAAPKGRKAATARKPRKAATTTKRPAKAASAARKPRKAATKKAVNAKAASKPRALKRATTRNPNRKIRLLVRGNPYPKGSVSAKKWQTLRQGIAYATALEAMAKKGLKSRHFFLRQSVQKGYVKIA